MKRRIPPSPPRLPEADALAAYCHECFVNPGEPCQTYKGTAKQPCRSRGRSAPAKPAQARDLFDEPADQADDGPPARVEVGGILYHREPDGRYRNVYVFEDDREYEWDPEAGALRAVELAPRTR